MLIAEKHKQIDNKTRKREVLSKPASWAEWQL
jgi:hypothetical protein